MKRKDPLKNLTNQTRANESFLMMNYLNGTISSNVALNHRKTAEVIFYTLLDEVSVMMAPGIDGRKGQTAVFDGIVKDNDKPYRLQLNSVQQWEGTETIWIRYSVKK